VGRANNVHPTYYVLDMALLTFFLSFLITFILLRSCHEAFLHNFLLR
jgi:hypothetical protein